MNDKPTLTLHDAMAKILRECEDHTAEQVILAEKINKRRLYWQQIGGPVSSAQIGARAKNYPHLFEKIPADPAAGNKARIRLR